MPYIEAVVFTRWVQDADGNNVPDAVDDIYAWARSNNEQLPDGSFGKYEDITGQSTSRILAGLKVFAAKLTITVATAQHFASDNRFWTLGFKRFDDEGEQVDSNWDIRLSSTNRQAAITYITNHGYTLEQIASKFDTTDTRLVIAKKLKALFLED